MIPDYRKQLIELAKEFILSARTIEGLNKISLIGSILTNKVKPKDMMFYAVLRMILS